MREIINETTSSVLFSHSLLIQVIKCVNMMQLYLPSNNGDPENGIKTGTDLEDLPSDWVPCMRHRKRLFLFSGK